NESAQPAALVRPLCRDPTAPLSAAAALPEGVRADAGGIEPCRPCGGAGLCRPSPHGARLSRVGRRAGDQGPADGAGAFFDLAPVATLLPLAGEEGPAA